MLPPHLEQSCNTNMPHVLHKAGIPSLYTELHPPTGPSLASHLSAQPQTGPVGVQQSGTTQYPPDMLTVLQCLSLCTNATLAHAQISPQAESAVQLQCKQTQADSHCAVRYCTAALNLQQALQTKTQAHSHTACIDCLATHSAQLSVSPCLALCSCALVAQSAGQQ